ncbi:MAG: hypothetical protein WCX22_10790, partial [Methanoregula sp.]
MKKIIASALVLGACLVLVLAAGCTQPTTTTVTTTAPTTPVDTIAETAEPTAIPTITEDSLTPGPTQALPEIWSMEVQVESNGEAINPQITTTLRGGKGMNVIPQIDVKITRSDGVVETGQLV